jgi:hypothetical protein
MMGIAGHSPGWVDLHLGRFDRVVDVFAGDEVDVGRGGGGDVGDEIAGPASGVGGVDPNQFTARFEFGDGHGQVVAGAAGRRDEVDGDGRRTEDGDGRLSDRAGGVENALDTDSVGGEQTVGLDGAGDQVDPAIRAAKPERG